MIGTEDADAVRCGTGGAATLFGGPFLACGGRPLACSRLMVAVSIDWDRGPPASSLIAGSVRGGSVLEEPQCCARIERLSSIGVKMLCDFAATESGFGCGNGGLWKLLCSG